MNKDIAKYGEKTRFTSTTAKAAQKKSAQRKLESGAMRKALLNYAALPSAQDSNVSKEYQIAVNIVEAALNGDAKAVDLYARLTGQSNIKIDMHTNELPPIEISFVNADGSICGNSNELAECFLDSD